MSPASSYFNPRSHERSDLRLRLRNTRIFSISIHAPTRGATFIEGLMSTDMKFQSTLPREERPFFFSSVQTPIQISIHAPTRGATRNGSEQRMVYSISIHAPTRGATAIPAETTDIFFPFQSTLPREERQQYCTKNLFIFIQYRQ